MFFDDDREWAEQLALSISSKYETSIATNPGHWNIHICSTQWDVIVVDVQIHGSPETGTERATKDILQYGITSPIIVISGVVNVQSIQKEYPGIFFGFISKDDVAEHLSELIDKACSINARTTHVKRMLTAFAKKYGMLKKKFPVEQLQDTMLLQLFKSANGETMDDFISMTKGESRSYLDRVGKIVLTTIRDRMPG